MCPSEHKSDPHAGKDAPTTLQLFAVFADGTIGTDLHTACEK